MLIKKYFKAFLYSINPWKKKFRIDTSRYDCVFELMERYKLEDTELKQPILTYVGRKRFVDADRKCFRMHSSDENKYDKEHNIKPRHLFHKRWWFHIGERQEITIEGVTSWPDSFYFRINWGGDNDLSINFWFIIKWYISLQRLPEWFMSRFKKTLPRYEYSREISLSIHNWAIWWRFWADSDSSSSKDSAWRRGSFYPIDKIKGKYETTTKHLDYKEATIYFKEGGYKIVSIRNVLFRKYKRFGFIFNRKWVIYNVIAGGFKLCKSLKDIKSYHYVIYEKADNYDKRRVLIEKNIHKDEDEKCRATNDEVIGQVKNVDKNSGIITMDDGEEIEWGKIILVVQEKGVPTSGDCTYSISMCADNHHEAIGKFYTSIIKERGNY